MSQWSLRIFIAVVTIQQHQPAGQDATAENRIRSPARMTRHLNQSEALHELRAQALSRRLWCAGRRAGVQARGPWARLATSSFGDFTRPVGFRTRSTRKRRSGRSTVQVTSVKSIAAFEEPLLRQLVLEPLLQLCAAFRRQAQRHALHGSVSWKKDGPATEGLGARPQHA